MCLKRFLFGLLFIGFAYKVDSILDGTRINWSKYSYLVKVFAKSSNLEVKTCSGALISNRIVITSSLCIMNENNTEPMKEFAVSMYIKNDSHHSSALLIDKTDQWALLKISKAYADRVCPKNSSMKSVVRLNLKPTLKAPSIITITPEEILESKCYLIGFNTTEEAPQFLSTTKTIRLNISVESPLNDEVYYRSYVTNNLTACFEDVGAPLICETSEHGTFLAGIFQKLGTPASSNFQDLNSRDFCMTAKEMYYSLIIEDTRLFNYFEEFDLVSLIKTYHDCGFISTHESNEDF